MTTPTFVLPLALPRKNFTRLAIPKPRNIRIAGGNRKEITAKIPVRIVKTLTCDLTGGAEYCATPEEPLPITTGVACGRASNDLSRSYS
jgi:hypothetical protein